MKPGTIAEIAWAISIVAQTVLVALLAWRRRRGFFPWWVAYGLARSVALYTIWSPNHGTNRYWIAFALSEPFDMMLLGAAAAEIAGVWLWCGCLLGVLLFVAPFTAIPHLPLQIEFQVRSLITAASVLSLGVLAGWRHRITPHQALLIAFCAIDLITYLAVLRGVRYVAQDVVMAGQCACLICWCWLARPAALA